MKGVNFGSSASKTREPCVTGSPAVNVIGSLGVNLIYHNNYHERPRWTRTLKLQQFYDLETPRLVAFDRDTDRIVLFTPPTHLHRTPNEHRLLTWGEKMTVRKLDIGPNLSTVTHANTHVNAAECVCPSLRTRGVRQRSSHVPSTDLKIERLVKVNKLGLTNSLSLRRVLR